MKKSDYRKDRIARYLREYTANLLREDPCELVGLDATEVADALSLNRTSASRDLNDLYRDGLAFKLLGKPTRYLHYYVIADSFHIPYLPHTLPVGARLSSLLEAPKTVGPAAPAEVKRSFLDTATVSLRRAADQAKAAVQYPSYGLHTLIVGHHGIGKKMFAGHMFDYGKQIGRFSCSMKLYTFDCQSISSPSQMGSQLFGTADGFPSPSSPGRRGLLDRAAGSILLLEEIQFLPLSIQEELINLITRGTFTRLGAGNVRQQCKLMLVATCSELPLPVQRCRLLQYFPMQIDLPPLSDRTPDEIFLHICEFFQIESQTLQCEFHISKDVMYYLMCIAFCKEFVSLSGFIKHICAMVYSERNERSTSHFLEIRYDHLPDGSLDLHPEPSIAARCSAYLQNRPSAYIMIRPDVLPMSSPYASTPDSTETSPLPSRKSSVPQLVEYYLQKYLYSAYISKPSDNAKNQATVAQLRSILQKDSTFRALPPDDPLFRGLLYLLSPQVSDAISQHISDHSDLRQFSSAIPTKTAALAEALDHALYQGAALSPQQSAFHAVCLHTVCQRALSERTLIVVAFHGDHVSEAIAEYLGQLYHHQRIVPVPFSETHTMASVFSCVYSAIEHTADISQILIFSDGIPLNELHRSVEKRFGIPARTLCASSFSAMQQTMEKLLRFHFSIAMLENDAGAGAVSETLRKSAQLSPLVEEAVQRYLVPSLSFIDFDSCIPLLSDSLKHIGLEFNLPLSDDISIKYYFHCAHMIERLIRKEPFNYQHLKPFLNQYDRLFHIIGNALQPTAQHYGISIPTSEIAYLVEMFLPS